MFPRVHLVLTDTLYGDANIHVQIATVWWLSALTPQTKLHKSSFILHHSFLCPTPRRTVLAQGYKGYYLKCKSVKYLEATNGNSKSEEEATWHGGVGLRVVATKAGLLLLLM